MLSRHNFSRRNWLRTAAATGLATVCPTLSSADTAGSSSAKIAITLDLEMSRNFPRREDTHWDYEKGNLTTATKNYAVEAGRRVKAQGGRIHYFCVGRVLEQEDVSWLQSLAEDGHPIGNHTYDHVNVLATKPEQLQFRFQRAPWLIAGMEPQDVIRENVRLTALALRQRANIQQRGFRTPGGFSSGLQDREDIQQLLQEAGFRWVSSKYPPHANTEPKQQPSEDVYRSIVEANAAAQPFRYPSGLIEIPMSPISDIGAFRTGQWELEWFLESIRRSVAWTIQHKAVFDFLAHPSCLVAVDPEFRAIDLICQLAAESNGQAQIVDLDTIANSVP